ncbi:MAG: hypothetical protein B6I32_05880, partial [Desulfobacterium sp. 4572_20]
MPDKTKIRPPGRSKTQKRGERESFHGGKHSKNKVRWFGPNAQKWAILIGLSTIISILLFPNALTRPKIYKLGDVADRDIKASRELLIENNELTEKSRQEATKEVLPVYDFDPTGTNILARIGDAFSAGRQYLAEVPSAADSLEKLTKGQSTNADAFKQGFFETLDVAPDAKVIGLLIKSGFPWEVEETTIDLVTQVQKKGIVINKVILERQSGMGIFLHNIHTGQELKVTDLNRFYDVKAARKIVNGQRQSLEKSLSSSRLAEVAVKLSVALIKPNLTFNKRETELRKDLARKLVKPFYFKVKKGE